MTMLPASPPLGAAPHTCPEPSAIRAAHAPPPHDIWTTVEAEVLPSMSMLPELPPYVACPHTCPEPSSMRTAHAEAPIEMSATVVAEVLPSMTMLPRLPPRSAFPHTCPEPSAIRAAHTAAYPLPHDIWTTAAEQSPQSEGQTSNPAAHCCATHVPVAGSGTEPSAHGWTAGVGAALVSASTPVGMQRSPTTKRRFKAVAAKRRLRLGLIFESVAGVYQLRSRTCR